MPDGDRDNDGVADELELTVTLIFDAEEGADIAERDVLVDLEAWKREGRIVDFRVHGG